MAILSAQTGSLKHPPSLTLRHAHRWRHPHRAHLNPKPNIHCHPACLSSLADFSPSPDIFLDSHRARSRHDLQRVVLSATVGNPADILTWIQSASRRRGVIIDPPKTPSPRHLRVIHRADLGALPRVAEHMSALSTAVFVNHSAVPARSAQPPRPASPTAPTHASSAPPPLSLASTSETLTASFNQKPRHR
jgi:hypothetical protein